MLLSKADKVFPHSFTHTDGNKLTQEEVGIKPHTLWSVDDLL